MIKMCDEMKKLRELLSERDIPWEDKSCICPSDFILESVSRGVPYNYADLPIYRTRFTVCGHRFSVIHGYGTYGGYDAFTGVDNGRLEVMSDLTNEPVGDVDADFVIKMVDNLLGKSA